MLAARAKIVGPLGLLLLLVGGAIGIGSAVTSSVAVAGANDSKLKALLEERHATLQAIASQVAKEFENGVATPGQVREANKAVLKAELDACDTDKERVVVLEKVLGIAKEQEKETDEAVKSGRLFSRDALKSKAERLDVEIALERARAK